MVTLGKEQLVVTLDDAVTPTNMEKLLDGLWGIGFQRICFKVGPIAVSHFGLKEIVRRIKGNSKVSGQLEYDSVMLDMQYQYSPAVISYLVKEAAECKVDFITVSGTSGAEGIFAASKKKGKAKIIVTTVPPTFDDTACKMAHGADIKNTALRFATAGQASGADGIMCSLKELQHLNKYSAFGGMLKFVTEIRIPGNPAGTLERTCTPLEALEHEADFLVLDSFILRDREPRQVLEAVLKSVQPVTQPEVQQHS